MCGKNYDIKFCIDCTLGSPPRVREKHGTKKYRADHFGITPACAGKTIWAKSIPQILRDHPRVCGKNASVVTDDMKPSGSPPRVREKLVLHLALCRRSRITPACAGKTT